MNKKELKKLENRFFCGDGYFPHRTLCSLFFHTGLEYRWDYYWNTINTQGKLYTSEYLPKQRSSSEELKAFLRLVIMYDFLRDMGEIE
jgi:hypothetical protein